MRRLMLIVLSFPLVTALPASAALEIGSRPSRMALKVDARANAEASWTQAGARRTIFIPPRGLTLPGGRLAGQDISRPSTAVKLPFLKVLKTALGNYWSLQSWAVEPGQPPQLRFSRWQGAPPLLKGSYDPVSRRLTAYYSYHGQPLSGYWTTPQGKQVRIVVYVEAKAATGWRRLIGVFPRADGSFRLFIRPEWQAASYRLVAPGPTRDLWRLPDTAGIVPG